MCLHSACWSLRHSCYSVAGRGPPPGPKSELLSNTELEINCLFNGNVVPDWYYISIKKTKKDILLEKGAQVESSREREPRELLCPMACSLRFYGNGVSFPVVFG